MLPGRHETWKDAVAIDLVAVNHLLAQAAPEPVQECKPPIGYGIVAHRSAMAGPLIAFDFDSVSLLDFPLFKSPRRTFRAACAYLGAVQSVLHCVAIRSEDPIAKAVRTMKRLQEDGLAGARIIRLRNVFLSM